ncbi:hypothetical protein ACTWP4_07205 [Gracilibacillus sp. D59]|uniref:hypothetical protein n=1 Tax=Gracilibacillus sp. D59 TaxID=3457434 RepID=UPI003FCE66A7
MNETLHTITISEVIMDSEDLQHKKTILKRHTEEIVEQDDHFYKLIDSIFINEDQKGEIIDSMLEQTQRLKRENLQIVEDVDQQIVKLVTNLNDQVDDIKEQRMTLTYRDNL